MKKVLRMMPFLMFFVFIFTLTSCGNEDKNTENGDSEHSHSYVIHQGYDATWNEEGKITYYTCEGCDKVFDSNKTEILATQIKIAPKKLSYDFLNFEWSGDNLSANAVYVNKTNSSDIVKLAANVTKTEKAATCDENGSVTYVATFDGNSFTKNLLISKAPHDYHFTGLQWSNDNQSAVAFYVCESNENHTKTENALISTTINGATCEESGTKTVKATYEGGFEEISIRLDAKGHDFSDIVIQPTCLEKGYTRHICNNCDYEYIDTYTEALGHKYDHAQTCTEGAECERCHHTVEALGHNYVLKETHDATCSNPKCLDYECDRCHDAYEITEGTANGHNIDGVTGIAELIDADCCEYIMKYKCNNCDEYVNGEIIYKHNYVASITEEATCQHGGIKTYTCNECGDYYDVDTEIDLNAHNWDLGVVTNGVRTDHCLNDGCDATRTVKVYEGTTTDAINAEDLANTKVEVNGANLTLDDDLVNSLSGKAVTLSVEETDKSNLNLTDEQKAQIGASKVYDFGMTSDSEKVDFNNNYITITLPYELQDGEDVDNIAIWFINDSGEVESIEATYNNGFVTFKTNHFSYYTITKLTPAERCALYGHQYDDKIEVMGGCTADSYDLYICKRCHHSYIDEDSIVKATGHNYVLDTYESYEATCTENGLEVYVCEHCSDSYTNTILALGHNHVVDQDKHVDATCKVAGKDTYVCKNCDDSYDVIIPILDHDYETTTVSATCEAFGYDLHECKNCHDSYKDNYTIPVTHTIVWTWNEDFTEATLSIECSSDPSHTKEANATIKTLSTTATCLHDGETVYQAIAVINDLTYTDTKTIKEDKLEHRPGSELSFDGDSHWYVCEMCHEKVNEEAHEFGSDNKCDKCGATTCDHEPKNRKFFNMADYYDDCCGLFIDYYTCDCGKVVTASQNGNNSPLVSLCNIRSKDMKEVQLPDGSMSQIVDCPDCGLHVESIYDPVVYSGTMIIYYNGENLFNIFIEGRRENHVHLEDYGCCEGEIHYYETSETKVPLAITGYNLGCPGFDGNNQGMSVNGHMIYEYDCKDCGLHYVKDTYQTTTDCYTEMHMDITISKGDTIILDVKQSQIMNQTHVYEYEILNPDKDHINCQNRVAVIERCRVCGEYHLNQFSSHTVNGSYNYQYNKSMDLSEHGINASIKYAECSVCGEKIYSDYESFRELSNLIINMTQREETINGVTHQITEYEISNSNCKMISDTYRVYSTICEYTYHNVTKIEKGNTVIFEYDNYYESSNHNYEEEYQFTSSEHDCEKGLIVTRTCARCGDTYSYTTTGHNTHKNERIDLYEEYGIPLNISYSTCPCEKETHIYLDFDKYGWQSSVSTYKDSKGIEHEVSTFTSTKYKAMIQTDKYMVPTATLCEYEIYTKYLITYDNRIVFNKTGHDTTYLHKDNKVYTFNNPDNPDCEDGGKITYTCEVCHRTYESTFRGHNQQLVSEIDLSQYSKCGGSIREYNCPCGKQHNIEFDFNCQFRYDECDNFITDSEMDTNLDYRTEIRTCGVSGCNFKVRYAYYYKRSDSCIKEFVQVYQIGYDSTNNTYIKEVIKTRNEIVHDREDIESETGTKDGLNYVIHGERCKHCDYYDTYTIYTDSNNRIVRTEQVSIDPLRDSNSRRIEYYEYFKEVNRSMIVERIESYGKDTRTERYEYNFSNCEVTITTNEGYSQSIRTEYMHDYMWLSEATCTQPAGYICKICGNIDGDYTYPLRHKFVLGEDNLYHCERCGLQSDSGVNGNVILEELYSYDCFIVGYYTDSSFYNFIEVNYVVEDGIDTLIIGENDIEFRKNDNYYSAIEVSRNELFDYIYKNYENLEISSIEMVFVSNDGFDYHITLSF